MNTCCDCLLDSFIGLPLGFCFPSALPSGAIFLYGACGILGKIVAGSLFLLLKKTSGIKGSELGELVWT